MGGSHDADSVALRLSVGGTPVWSGAAELSDVVGDDDTKLRIRLEVGPELADLARERDERRRDAGPYEGTLEDALWELVDVQLSTLPDDP
jgi:hypothetical protein